MSTTRLSIIATEMSRIRLVSLVSSFSFHSSHFFSSLALLYAIFVTSNLNYSKIQIGRRPAALKEKYVLSCSGNPVIYSMNISSRI